MKLDFSVLGWDKDDYHTSMKDIIPRKIIHYKQYKCIKNIALILWYFSSSWEAYENFEWMVLNILNKNPHIFLNTIFKVSRIFVLNIEAWLSGMASFSR